MGTPPRTSASNGGSHGGSKPHPRVLVVPYPAQGHMLPLLDLAALLAARGLALTVTVTADNVPPLARLLVECPSVATVVLPFPSSPFLPAGCVENTKDSTSSARSWPPSPPSARRSSPWCKAQPHGVTAVVSDLFTGWTLPLAEELGVPHVAFSCSGVHYLSTSHSLWRRMPSADDANDADETVAFPEVPGSPNRPLRRLPWMFRMHVAGDEVSETIRQIFLWNLESSCFVANTFAALEPAYVERPVPDLMAKRVFAVGSLSDAVPSCIGRGGEPTVAPANVAAWLDAFGDGSVVYVCFVGNNLVMGY